MLKKRISQKSIIEEYKLLEGAGSLFRIRMNENWILRYKDFIQKKIIKKELNHTDFEDALAESLSLFNLQLNKRKMSPAMVSCADGSNPAWAIIFF